MQIILVFFLVALSWKTILVDSLALPTNDVKEAPKDVKEELKIVPALQQEKDTKTPLDLKRHNVDLSKVSITGEQKVETVEKEATPWDSRQIIFNGYVNLKWVTWSGSLPNGAVSINNQHMGRTDYVCSEQGCATGYYSPGLGAYCFYSDSGSEYRTTSFKILVNEDNFELILWKDGSYGSVPEDSVNRCPGVYVGKNQYGLGKVVPSQRVLYLPFGGSEYSYDYYEVLHLYSNYHTQHIKNVQYFTNQVLYSSEAVEVLATSKVINDVCQRINKLITVSKTRVHEQYWEIGRPTKTGVSTILTTQVPYFSGNQVTLLNLEEFEWKEGTSHTKTQTHSRSLEVYLEPYHECEVVLQGRTMYANMPFSAELSRIYQNGEVRSTTIQGRFSNQQTDEVTVALNYCRRIPNSPPCPSI